MRILLVNHRLDYSGPGSYTMDLATSLRERGDDVRLCTTGGELQKRFEARGVPIYRVRYNLLSYWKLIDFLRDYNPDLIHVQSLSSLVLGRRLAGKLDKPYVLTLHRRPGFSGLRLDVRLLCGVIALNEVIREALVNDRALPKGLVRVIRRGVLIPKLRSEPGEQVSRIPVVGSVGRLSREKGHHCLVEAAAKVLDRGTNAHFAIVGEGPEERSLRGLVKELNLQYHVTFSPHVDNRRDLYRLFDIVVLPVLRSGVGITALEAMSMRKPLIASAVGEMLHIVQDGRTGLLFPEGNADVLADRLIELIHDPELMETLARQGRAWVEKNFNLSAMVNETRAYYEEALSAWKEKRALAGVGAV